MRIVLALFLSKLPRALLCGFSIEPTDRSRLDHVSDGESLDCLVLGAASRAVGAADWLYAEVNLSSSVSRKAKIGGRASEQSYLDVAAALLVATVGSSLLDHDCGCEVVE